MSNARVPVWFVVKNLQRAKTKDRFWVKSNSGDPNFIPKTGTKPSPILEPFDHHSRIIGVYSEHVSRMLESLEQLDLMVVKLTEYEDYGLWMLILAIVNEIGSTGTLNEHARSFVREKSGVFTSLTGWQLADLMQRFIDETILFFRKPHTA